VTIHESQSRPYGARYRLGFPNEEVRISLPRAILREYVPDRQAQQRAVDEAFSAVERDEPDRLRAALHAFFAAIPHDWHRNNDIAAYEGYWASLVYCLFAALGLSVRAEEATNRGQIDLTIPYQGRVWLLEFKMDERNAGKRALEQIKTQGYAQRYAGQPVTLIGIDFSARERNLSGFAWERRPATPEPAVAKPAKRRTARKVRG
jgi:hypothetical protein